MSISLVPSSRLAPRQTIIELSPLSSTIMGATPVGALLLNVINSVLILFCFKLSK